MSSESLIAAETFDGSYVVGKETGRCVRSKETHIVSHLKGRSSSRSHSGVELLSYLKAAAKLVKKVSVCEPVYSPGVKSSNYICA